MEWPLVGREAELARSLRLIESGRGVALLGDAGVGKSRLLHELTNQVESSGVTVFRGIATESTRSVPFAPFVSLLPEDSTENRTELFRRVLAKMGEMAGGRRLLIALDDAHHLDDGSLALLATAVSTDTATLCLTARTGETMKSDLMDLWTNGVIERLEIGPLGEKGTSALIKSTLGEVEPRLLARLWEIARGNPLVLHEVVEGAVGRAITPGEGNVWRLEGVLEESPRLADLVRARTDQIPGDLRHALELVSIGAPLLLSVLEKAADVDAPALEATQLVSLERSGDAWVVAPAHPLHGEVLVANLGDAQKRRLHRELLEAATELGGVVDDLQLAVWQRDAGTIEFPDTAVKGALVALGRHDPILAEELIRPVTGSSTHAGVILGRALSFQHRFEEAEDVLAGVQANDPAILAELASARAHNLGFGLGRVSEAVEMLDTAARSVEDDSERARLDVERGIISAIRGDFTAAEKAGRSVVANAAATSIARASGYVSLALSLAMTANCDGFGEIIGDAYESAKRAKTDAPLAEDQIGCMELCALCVAGRPGDAVAVGGRFKKRAAGSGLYSFWLDALAIAYDLSGQLRDGLESAVEAQDLMQESDPFGLQLQARGISALERGQMGDPGGREDVERIEFDLPDPRLSVWVERGRVWSRVAEGAIDEAAELAVAGGRSAIENQHYSWGGPAAHDAVRLDRPELVVGELSQLRNDKGAHLLNTMADHADSLVAGDGPALVDVAKTFATMGAWLLAAETAAQAAIRLESGEAAVAASLSMGWELRCQEPRTPALAARPALVSAREFQVAMDAAKGHTSPEISRDLYISVRTVDNHLRSVYRKVGVGGRDELAEILSPLL